METVKRTIISIKPKPPNKTISLSCLENCCLTLMNTEIVYTFINNLVAPYIVYITMSAGGGAGGIGRIMGNYFISGGGGGAGSTIQQKPILLKPNDQLHLKLGKGGCSKTNLKGEKSYIRVSRKGCTIYELTLEGGKNGHPLLCELSDDIVSYDQTSLGGCGGQGQSGTICFGGNGKKGMIGIPSQLISLGGNGGCNSFEMGGNGGGNQLSQGGLGGNTEKDVNITGENGQFGSGGGGSCPLSKFDLPQLSGCGGDGFANVTFCCEIL